jgi:hypothetical protein
VIGTSTRGQIKGSVCGSSMRTLAISLERSDAALCFLVMPPVRQARSANSRAAADQDGVIVDAGRRITKPGVGIDIIELGVLCRPSSGSTSARSWGAPRYGRGQLPVQSRRERTVGMPSFEAGAWVDLR